ncbi:YeiH family protein [Halanaerocella petrolearia]
MSTEKETEEPTVEVNGKSVSEMIFEKIPGVLLLFVVGYLSKWIALYIPHIEYVLIAIIIGMFFGNTFNIPKIFVPGIDTYELWLKLGIVVLGARLVLQNVLKIGGVGIVLVILEIIFSLILVEFLAKQFGVSDKLGSLLAMGTGICGVSVIIGATGAIDADEEESGLAIATILIFSAVTVFLYPIIGQIVNMSDQIFGFWSGLAVDNTAEALATGFAYSDQAGQYATVIKLSRNALMGIIVLLYSIYYARKGMTTEVDNKVKFVWKKFPKFLIGFLLLSLLSTLGLFTQDEIGTMKNLYKWIFMLSFAGVGFRTDFDKMREIGLKSFFVGFGGEVLVSIATILTLYAIY